jgi:hypothetical protein
MQTLYRLEYRSNEGRILHITYQRFACFADLCSEIGIVLSHFNPGATCAYRIAVE